MIRSLWRWFWSSGCDCNLCVSREQRRRSAKTPQLARAIDERRHGGRR